LLLLSSSLSIFFSNIINKKKRRSMSYNELDTFDINDTTQQPQQEDGTESDYSLDYEYLGPRKPNYRNEQDADSDASELSSTSSNEGFDMWDEDPYSTNDFTWESNDMRLTGFMKQRQRQLQRINSLAPWQPSFYRKEKGWPKQLPASSSTTNHDQSANALSLVLSDLGSSEKLHAVYRDRIIECGKYHSTKNSIRPNKINDTTYLDHEEWNTADTSSSSSSSGSSSTNKFIETHASISHSNIQQIQHQPTCKNTNSFTVNNNNHLLSKFIPYTKYIQRTQFPAILPQSAYLALGFEPMCLAEKYGYMAIGGIEGEFELYCCMDREKPIKIWGTKFKGKNNVLLMTNAVQIVRWKQLEEEEYSYYLIACMNDAGILIYDLPSHRQCQSPSFTTACNLQCHIRTFDRVPINDARVSPDGKHLVCVGDEACLFLLTVSFNQQGRIVFGQPKKFTMPLDILTAASKDIIKPLQFTFSSQYVAWSKSSVYVAHTSDTDNHVFIWRTKPQLELIYRIDAGGYTYAIQFHPELEGVLAFSNRYGYLHTVNLEECISKQDPHCIIKLLAYDRQTPQSTGHSCTQTCLPNGNEAIFHTAHLYARHEITMVSFRGEKNRRLRILAKINGLQWSRDGCYLYVSTKKRVLAYEFMQSSCRIQSLEKMASQTALSILEQEHTRLKRKKNQDDDHDNRLKRRRQKTWYKKWDNMPVHVRNNVLGDTHLASHW
jgi:hypothetical protein